MSDTPEPKPAAPDSPAAQETAPEDEAALDPVARIAELEGQLAEANDRILRLAAEVENTRRRAEREKQDAARYGIAAFAKELLTVADTFERALKAAPENPAAMTPAQAENMIVGVRMTEKELLAAFERHGLRKISPEGERFDPAVHQAVAEVPGGGLPKGHVVDVAQAGYVIGDRTLRAAMVTVSNGEGASGPGGKFDRSV